MILTETSNAITVRTLIDEKAYLSSFSCFIRDAFIRSEARANSIVYLTRISLDALDETEMSPDDCAPCHVRSCASSRNAEIVATPRVNTQRSNSSRGVTILYPFFLSFFTSTHFPNQINFATKNWFNQTVKFNYEIRFKQRTVWIKVKSVFWVSSFTSDL